jgi:hypothetical protein
MKPEQHKTWKERADATFKKELFPRAAKGDQKAWRGCLHVTHDLPTAEKLKQIAKHFGWHHFDVAINKKILEIKNVRRNQ